MTYHEAAASVAWKGELAESAYQSRSGWILKSKRKPRRDSKLQRYCPTGSFYARTSNAGRPSVITMQDEPSEQSQVSNLSRDPCNARSKTWDSLGSGRRATTDEPTRSPVRTGDPGVFQLELLERRQPANLRWDATCTIALPHQWCPIATRASAS